MKKDYQHFYDVYCDLDNKKNIYFAQAYRYRHAYASEKMDMEQQILERSTGVLLIRELPDTVRTEGDRGRGLFCCMGSYDQT